MAFILVVERNLSSTIPQYFLKGSFLVLQIGVITRWCNRKDWKDTKQYPHTTQKRTNNGLHNANKQPFKGITNSIVIL